MPQGITKPLPATRVLGLDIGGANIKAAHSQGSTVHQPFALWKYPGKLADTLGELVRELPSFDQIAVTMTGEFCDCFATKREGVNAILDAVQTVAPLSPIRVWQTEGRFVEAGDARKTPLQTAAANWMALAAFAGRLFSVQSGLVIDVGSTTTDIIPIFHGKPVPQGRTDRERLQSRELIYSGVRRTPLCALLGSEGAAEFFATTHDVHVILGNTAEDEADCETADGRPAARRFALARLARMVGADQENISQEELHRLAEKLFRRQRDLLQEGFRRVAERLPEPPQVMVISGSGEFLARAAISPEPDLARPSVLSWSDKLGPDISRVACAYAVMMLAREEPHG